MVAVLEDALADSHARVGVEPQNALISSRDRADKNLRAKDRTVM